jgi:chromosome segregation ATPase
MPRKGISYEQVAKACTELEKSQRLSVRAIQAKTGGSMTTVLKHYRRWQREQLGQYGVETVLSDRLRHALLSELEEAAAQSRQAVQQELQEVQQQIVQTKKNADSNQRRLNTQLQQVHQQKSLLEQKSRDTQQRTAAIEKQLRSAQTRIIIQKKALHEEQRKRQSSETALRQMQNLQQVSENRLANQELLSNSQDQPPQETLQPKKVAASKNRGQKVQQSLFDF